MGGTSTSQAAVYGLRGLPDVISRPGGRNQHSMAFDDFDRLIVLGGCSSSPCVKSTSTWQLDTSSMIWTWYASVHRHSANY
jgi:hypothetical protein